MHVFQNRLQGDLIFRGDISAGDISAANMAAEHVLTHMAEGQQCRTSDKLVHTVAVGEGQR